MIATNANSWIGVRTRVRVGLGTMKFIAGLLGVQCDEWSLPARTLTIARWTGMRGPPSGFPLAGVLAR
jgi:hypothetical protein